MSPIPSICICLSLSLPMHVACVWVKERETEREGVCERWAMFLPPCLPVLATLGLLSSPCQPVSLTCKLAFKYRYSERKYLYARSNHHCDKRHYSNMLQPPSIYSQQLSSQPELFIWGSVNRSSFRLLRVILRSKTLKSIIKRP